MNTHPLPWIIGAIATVIVCAGLWWYAAHTAGRYTAPTDVLTTVADVDVPDTPEALDTDPDACPGCGGHHDIADADPKAVATLAFLSAEIDRLVKTLAEHAAAETVPASVVVVVPTAEGIPIASSIIDPEAFPDVEVFAGALVSTADRLLSDQGEINFRTAQKRAANGGRE